MTNTVQNVNMNKTGMCPHGTIPGACPICSGMSGGGRVGERAQKPGEMSYHECAVIGAMMRAREAQQKLHEQTLLIRAENLKNFEQNLKVLSEKMTDFVNTIQKNFFLKPIAFTINIFIIPIIKFVSGSINFLVNIIDKLNQIKETLINIIDKLNAIFGEAKAFIDKKISEFVNAIKSKFKIFFKIFKREKNKNEEDKVNEEKRIFRLKTFIQKLLGKKKDDSKNKSGS